MPNAPLAPPELTLLRNRLRGIIVLACLVPVLLALALSVRSAYSGLQTRVETGRTALDTFAQTYIRATLHAAEKQVSALSQRLDLDALDRGLSMVNSDWLFMQRLNSNAHYIFFYDLRRNDLATNVLPPWQTDAEFDATTRPWYAGLDTPPDSFFWSNVYRDYSSRTPVISVSRSVYDDTSRLRGLLCFQIRLDELRDAMVALVAGAGSHLQLERDDGTPLLSTTSDWLKESLTSQPSGMSASLWSLIHHGAMIPVYLDAPAWVLRLHIPAAEVRALLAEEIGNSVLPLLALFTALALLLGFLLRRYEQEQRLLGESLEGLSSGQQPGQASPDLMFVGHNIRRLSELASTLDAHRSAALRDALTGAFNRHAFSADFARAMESTPHALGLILFDIDHFKRVNDEHGHAFGDAVLARLADALRQAGLGHHLYRFGGDEFALLLPASETVLRAKSLCELVRNIEWRERGMRFTISVGAALGSERSTHEALFELADQRLYASKHAGRNRATVPPLAA